MLKALSATILAILLVVASNDEKYVENQNGETRIDIANNSTRNYFVLCKVTATVMCLLPSRPCKYKSLS